MKRICAITMVRNDEFFLKKWIEYYGNQLGEENLYVLLDGEDQSYPDLSTKVNYEVYKRVEGLVAQSDKRRINILSDKAARLLDTYDFVIGTDSDEFLIVDPKLNIGLKEFLSNCNIGVCASALGVDVGQNLHEEDDLIEDKKILSQRHYARLSTRYTKANIISKPVRWGSGFHRVKGHNFHIMKDLYLFHFGYCDMEKIKNRFTIRDSKNTGWEKHIKKRSKNIRYTTSRKAFDFDSSVKIARFIQTIFRPPYSLNKPSMFNVALIVRIPRRFENIV